MPKFCGKCGAMLNHQGNCPYCEPNPNPNFIEDENGSLVEFEIPKSSPGTMLAGKDGSSEDSVNIPQTQPPVLYENADGNNDTGFPVSTPPIPLITPNNEENIGTKKKRNTAHQPRKHMGVGIKLVCILLVVCVLFVGVGVLSYHEIIYIPGVSDYLRLSLEEQIYGEEQNNFIITGDKISNINISDEDKAKQVAKKFTEELGYESISNNYTLINSSEVGGYTYYRFQENYEGYPVVGRMMTVIADKDGNSCGISSNVIDISKTIKLDIAEFDKDKVLDALQCLNDSGVEVNVNAYTKSIYSFDHCENPVLTYEVMAVVNNLNFMLFIDPDEEEIVNGYCLDSGNASILEGNGKDMPDNPQKFNGTLYGTQWVTADEERNIYVYNANKGSSTIVIEYYDDDDISYYNRRFDLKNAGEMSNDEVCVLYDDDGNYYEYDKVKKLFINGDAEIDPNNLSFEGYTVFNRASGKAVPLVSSDDKIIRDELAVRLMVNTAHTYDFFDSVLDRQGYDGKGGRMLAVCNDYLSGEPSKAFSAGDNNGFSMITFGYDNAMSIVNIAHEYTHSVEQSICALNYQGESGALMEGYADVFAEIVEDYYNDSEPSIDNLNNNCTWQIEDRNLKMPIMGEMPDTYLGRFYEEKLNETKWDESNLGLTNDFDQIHNNGTVISHTAYLMVSGENKDETLTIKELADLWYRTLFILPSNCTFSAFRDCMELQADKMFESKELTNKQREYVSVCFDKSNIYSTHYSNNIEIKVEADSWDNSYKLKIEGKRFKLITLKDYSKEFSLTEGSENGDGTYTFSENIELEDGRYTIKITDEKNKSNCYEREILVMSGDNKPQYNNQNDKSEFFFEKTEENGLTSSDVTGSDFDTDIPNTASLDTDIQNTDLMNK